MPNSLLLNSPIFLSVGVPRPLLPGRRRFRHGPVQADGADRPDQGPCQVGGAGAGAHVPRGGASDDAGGNGFLSKHTFLRE